MEPTLAYYRRTGDEGLAACFTAAIPFFRYTLIGDASFAFVLFSSYALLTAPAAQRLVARR